MKTHYTEADLLETYYTEPGQSMPVMMHLAACSECAARYDRLDRKIREAAACHVEKSEEFWAAQRAAVMSRLRGGRSRSLARFAAAAALVLTVGGTAAYQIVRGVPAPAPQAAEEQVSSDPWQTEELQEFGAVVEWETWIEEKPL